MKNKLIKKIEQDTGSTCVELFEIEYPNRVTALKYYIKIKQTSANGRGIFIPSYVADISTELPGYYIGRLVDEFEVINF